MKISVIVPFYNEQDYIDRCVQSLLAQTKKPHEIILVDNNSTDGSRAAAKSYGKKVKVLNAKQQGPGFARDKGFTAATGDILARIDADTRIDPDWIARIESAFEEKNIAAVSGSATFYDVPLGRFWQAIMRLYFFEFNALVCGVRPLYGSNMAIRAKEYESVRNKLTHANEIWEDLEMGIVMQSKIIKTISLPASVSMRSAYVRASNMAAYMQRWTRTYAAHEHTRGIIGSRVGLGAILIWWPLVYVLTRRQANLAAKA